MGRVQHSIAIRRCFFCLLFFGTLFSLNAQNNGKEDSAEDSTAIESTMGMSLSKDDTVGIETLKINRIQSQHKPFVSLQQTIKGVLSGVYVQEPTGEPGAQQNIFVRGLSYPLLSKKELFSQQPAVFLNGIPLSLDNPFAYEIQKYDFNRIGTATNLLATINPNNIESIEVIKDPTALALLGPLAANGAIWVVTKNAKSGKSEITVNSYTGFALKERTTAVNAAYENEFRAKYYNKFGTASDRLNYPPYLRDSTNTDYYGSANWQDLYYRNGLLYSADISLMGGGDRANFRFFGSATQDAGNTDENALGRYSGSFFINVKPLEWFTVSSMINYNRLQRTRNLNIRDRLAEQRYIPDLINPLTPNKNLYGAYLAEFDKAIDKNVNNSLQGYLALNANYANLHYNGRLAFDYNDGNRDAFWPTTLLEGNNFVSSYAGYNQRIVLSNSVAYLFDFENDNKFKIEAGQIFNSDINRYNYMYAYNTPNDYVKTIEYRKVPPDETPQSITGVLVYPFTSSIRQNLTSFYGNAEYAFGDWLTASAVVKREGASNMQPQNKWFTSYSGSVEWNIKKHLLQTSDAVGALTTKLSYGRIGKAIYDDRYAAGPHYAVELGWGNEPGLGSYAGIPGASRPYSSGWVGYNIPWSYSDQFNLAFNYGTIDNRLSVMLDVYNRNDKDQLFLMPVPFEYGYKGTYSPGFNVNNKGVELSLSGNIVKQKQLNEWNWDVNANLSYNSNKLIALPNGLDETVSGQNKFKVGERIDAFWLLQNNGIYNSNEEVPVNSANGQPLNYQGLPLTANDPRWVDGNNDYTIDNKDRTLVGNYIPKFTGGFGSNIAYNAFNLDFQFYFVAGRKVLNQYAATRLDFINTDANNSINSVKEITFWEKRMDFSNYPVYNPWSPVIPYRLEQDLFLDDASFIKLRSVTLNYDLSAWKRFSKNKSDEPIKKKIIYITATNLITFTKFKGDDPELAGYNGIYTGYGLPIPRTVVLGVRLDL